MATARIAGPVGRLAARFLLGPGDAFMAHKQLRVSAVAASVGPRGLFAVAGNEPTLRRGVDRG